MITLIADTDESVRAIGRAAAAAGGLDRLFGKDIVQVIRVEPGAVPLRSAGYGPDGSARIGRIAAAGNLVEPAENLVSGPGPQPLCDGGSPASPGPSAQRERADAG